MWSGWGVIERSKPMRRLAATSASKVADVEIRVEAIQPVDRIRHGKRTSPHAAVARSDPPHNLALAHEGQGIQRPRSRLGRMGRDKITVEKTIVATRPQRKRPQQPTALDTRNVTAGVASY